MRFHYFNDNYHTHTYRLTLTHIHIHSHTLTYTHRLTLTHTYTHTHIYAHTHTHYTDHYVMYRLRTWMLKYFDLSPDVQPLLNGVQAVHEADDSYWKQVYKYTLYAFSTSIYYTHQYSFIHH